MSAERRGIGDGAMAAILEKMDVGTKPSLCDRVVPFSKTARYSLELYL